jgi:hypothetical protein
VLLPLLEVSLRHFVLVVGLPLAVWFVLVTVVLLLERRHRWVPVPLLDPLLVVALAVLVAVADLVVVLVVDSLAVLLHAAVLFALSVRFGPLCWLLFVCCWMNALLRRGSVWDFLFNTLVVQWNLVANRDKVILMQLCKVLLLLWLLLSLLLILFGFWLWTSLWSFQPLILMLLFSTTRSSLLVIDCSSSLQHWHRFM